MRKDEVYFYVKLFSYFILFLPIILGQSQHNLGDFCIPGTCASLNSNCKRVGGNAFRCVCKDQYISVNKTHCGTIQCCYEKIYVIYILNLVKVINASLDATCTTCNERGGVCLDENSDNYMDKCFCQPDNDLCHDRTTSTTPIPTTETPEKKYINFILHIAKINTMIAYKRSV